MKTQIRRLLELGRVVLAVIVFCLLSPVGAGPQDTSQFPSGSTQTLLSDGRWLVLGGFADRQTLSTAETWDPVKGIRATLPAKLQHPRAWHTATMLPDGTVFIFGGVGPDGRLISEAELFNPQTDTFETLPSTGLSPRSKHTTTLLTDGLVFIAGGLSDAGGALKDAELWDFESGGSAKVADKLRDARYGHSAALLADGRVLLSGGLDSRGGKLASGELFGPDAARFTSVTDAQVQELRSINLTSQVMDSLPADGVVNVPLNSYIAVRFSTPMRVETVNAGTIVLSGPEGVEKALVVAAEGGMLAFVTPESVLTPGTTYSVILNGPTDKNGFSLPLYNFSFVTQSLSGTPPSAAAARSSSNAQVSNSGLKVDDDFVWQGALKDGKPYSPWQDLSPLQAEQGVTALAGQALDLQGKPLADVYLGIAVEGKTVKASTDNTGRFLLEELEPGSFELVIDGRPAHSPVGKVEDRKWGYGIFEYRLEIQAGTTNVLPFTIWLPKIDSAHVVTLPSQITSEIIATTPLFPDFELHISSGTIIKDRDGKTVREITITPVPTDRTPFPIPDGMNFPAYSTIQPGGAYIYGPGAHIVYPNKTKSPPGARSSLWHYDPDGEGWYIYGQGTVTDDGKQIVPDQGVKFYSFTGAGASFPQLPAPARGPVLGGARGGDPVDLRTGLFVHEKTDVFLPDVLPITLTRTYRQLDTVIRSFGMGTSHPYEMFLTGTPGVFTFVNLVLADGRQIHYDRISPGTGFADAVLEHVATPTRFYKSRITWNNSSWELKLKDGTIYTFGSDSGLLLGIKDRYGNQITVTRSNGQSGNITKITSPNGRSISFTYDGTSNRISQVTDLVGRTVNYAYDASGRLTTVTDQNSGVTQYTYDTSNRMITLKDPRNIVYLTNEYYSDGKVKKQTSADNAIFQFAYTLDGNGNVTQADVTDPRGFIRRITYDSVTAYPLSDTRALGQSEQQTNTYVRQSGSSLVLSETDALSRKTTYAYDSLGNVTSITRLADTPDAVTTSFTYEPVFNQMTSTTDPLNHTTSFGRDSQGNLISVTNPLNQTSTVAYNEFGQPTSATDPLNHTTVFAYDFGDLAAVTDPFGNTTSRFTDAAGRLDAMVNPLGNTTIYNYDPLNHMTAVTDAISGVTQFGYDANGNLLSVTDARNNATAYTYNSMDRLSTRTDPLLNVETYNTYDNSGNLTQFTDRKSQVSNYTYDSLNRRTGVTYADTSTTTYTYDAGNRLTQIVDSVSGTITRTYDGLDRLTSETTPQGTVSYTYDNAGRRATMTVSGQADTISYTYDNANRLTQITQGTSVVSFAYDAAGRRTSLTLPNNVVTEYTYDNASRVTGLTYKLGAAVLGDLTYQYDKAGNRISVDGTWARTGIPQAVATTNYDNANRQLTFGDKTLTYDNNGNLTSILDGSGTTLYSWNARNQLSGISGPGVSASFAYDGSGRREQKTVNNSLTEFFYDGINPVQESSGATILANALTGFAPDEFFTRADSSATRIPLQDSLGSILALTDSTGTLQSESTYEPFGNATVSGPSIPFQYTGRENDLTGLYYYRARYYNPQIGRFISEDPLDFAGGDVNFYAYVGNNPIDRIDPTGEFAVLGSLIGGLGNLSYQLYENGGNINCVNWWQVGAWALTGSGAGSLVKGGFVGIRTFFWNPGNFRTISRQYWAAQGGAAGMSLDHWLISQAAGRAGNIPNGIVNAGFNLLEIPSTWNTWLGFAPNWGGLEGAIAQAARLGIQIGIPGLAGAAAYTGYEIGIRGRERCDCR